MPHTVTNPLDQGKSLIFWRSLSQMAPSETAMDLAGKARWCVSVGAAAAAVLLLAGGQKAFQAASISTGLSLNILLMFGCVGLMKILRQETLK